MTKEKEMNPSSQMVFDMAKIFLDIQTSSFESGMKHAKEDAEREQKMQDFADKCERDLEEKPIRKKLMSDRLEDKHLQIDLTKDKNCPLLDYDLILRTNDEGTKYVGFDIYDYKNQTPITWVSFEEKANE